MSVVAGTAKFTKLAFLEWNLAQQDTKNLSIADLVLVPTAYHGDATHQIQPSWKQNDERHKLPKGSLKKNTKQRERIKKDFTYLIMILILPGMT